MLLNLFTLTQLYIKCDSLTLLMKLDGIFTCKTLEVSYFFQCSFYNLNMTLMSPATIKVSAALLRRFVCVNSSSLSQWTSCFCHTDDVWSSEYEEAAITCSL